MEKLINEPGAVVDEMLDGTVAAHPELRRLDGTNVPARDDAPAGKKVAVISGSGSGHEPTHTGYLGEGMLDNATTGEVFTSPTVNQLNEMIQATDAGGGVLCVVKNYEGNVMNFGAAAEMVGVGGVDVEQVVVNGDVTVEDSLYTSGRYGVAGTTSVHKCAGTKAAVSGDLDEVTAVTEKVVDDVRTIGMVLASCVTPEKGEPTPDLGGDEIEFGAGIHGKPGTEHVGTTSADETTGHLTENVLDDLDLDEGEKVATMVNGMDGVPLSEPYIVNRKLQSILNDRGVEAWDAWVGDYMASPDMVGYLVSVLHIDDESEKLPSAPAETPDLTVTE